MATRILVNSSWNFGAFAFSVLANFVAIPFVVRTIGLSAFGEVGLLLAVYAPLSLIGTVVGQAIIHALSAPRKADSDATPQDAIWAAFALTLVACAVATLLVVAAMRSASALLAAHGFKVASATLPLLIGLGWSAQQLALVLQSAFAGAQRYGDVARATVASTVLNVGAIVFCTWLSPDASGYASGIGIGFGLALLSWIAWTIVTFPGALRPRVPSPGHTGEIYAFGRWQAIAFLVSTGALQTDRYLLGLWSPLKAVGQYSVAVRLQEVVSMAVLKISEVLFPHFGATRTDDASRRTAFFLTSSWIVGTVSVVAMMPLLPLAHALISLWVNPEAADAGAPVLHLLLSAAALGAGATVYTYQALGTGRSNELAALTIAQAACTVLIAIPMIRLFGIAGAGVGIVVANALRLLACWLLVSRNFGSHMPMSTLSTMAGSPIVAGLAAGWIAVARWEPGVMGWGSLIAAYAAMACATLAIVILATSLHVGGRQLLAAMRTRVLHAA